MDSREMQAVIDGFQWELHNLFLLASEPGQTPVHPERPIDRDGVPTVRCATDDHVESLLAEF